MESFVSYIENLCKLNADVAHDQNGRKSFYRFDFEELAQAVRSISHFPAVVLEGDNLKYIDNKGEVIFKPHDTAIIFIDRVKDVNNYLLKQQKYDEIEALSSEFFLRMRQDAKTRTISAITNFNLNDVNGMRMSDEGNRLLMWRFEFTVEGRMLNEVDNDKWTDL
jgi:hypothetical protein